MTKPPAPIAPTARRAGEALPGPMISPRHSVIAMIMNGSKTLA